MPLRGTIKKKNMSPATSGNMYQCSPCKKCFRSNLMYRKHMKLHSEKALTCPICDAVFTHKEYLLAHMLGHTKPEKYQCRFCPKYFQQKSNLNQHMKFHLAKNLYKCELCNKEFVDQEDLRLHLIEHNNSQRPSYECELCSKTFNIKSSLQRHMSCHSGVKPFICDICKRGYTRRSVLMLHIQQVHENKKPYQCSACEMCFSQKGNLQAHYKRKHLQPKSDGKWTRGRRPLAGRKKTSFKNSSNSSKPVKNSNYVQDDKESSSEDEELQHREEVDEVIPDQTYGLVEDEQEDLDDELMKFFSSNNDLIASLSDNEDGMSSLQNPFTFSMENLAEDTKMMMSEFDMLLADPKGWEDLLSADPSLLDSMNDIMGNPSKPALESKARPKDSEGQSANFHNYSSSSKSWADGTDLEASADNSSPKHNGSESADEIIIPDKFLLSSMKVKIKEELVC